MVTWSNSGWLFFLESVLASYIFFFLKIEHVFLSFQTDWNKVAHDVLFARKFYFWKYLLQVVVVVQSLSRVQLFATPWTATHQAALSSTISWSLLKLMSTESMMSSNHLLCPLLPSPPALTLSQHQGLFQ